MNIKKHADKNEKTNSGEKPEVHESARVTEIVGFKRAVPIILFAVASFIALCFITQSTGLLGAFISKLLLGLFSYGAYFIPPLFILHGIFFFRDVKNKCVASRTVFSFITIITVSALESTIYNYSIEAPLPIKDYYALGISGAGGGLIGRAASLALMKVFGSVGMIIIAVAVLALYVSFFFAKSKQASGRFFYFLLSLFTGALAHVERGVMSMINKFKSSADNSKSRKQKKRNDKMKIKNPEFFADDFFSVDNGLRELKIAELGIVETRSNAFLEENPTLHEKVFHKSAVEDAKERIEHTARANEESYISSENKRSKTVSFHQRENDIIYDEGAYASSEYQEPKNTPAASSTSSINKMYGLDENAEEVFTSDFDPFNFVASEALVNKPSSKAQRAENIRGVGNTEESISHITEEDIKRARDVERFERRKREILENSRRTAKPVTDNPTSYGEAKNVEINVTGAEKIVYDNNSKPYSVTIDKLEAQMNRQATRNDYNNLHNNTKSPDNNANYTDSVKVGFDFDNTAAGDDSIRANGDFDTVNDAPKGTADDYSPYENDLKNTYADVSPMNRDDSYVQYDHSGYESKEDSDDVDGNDIFTPSFDEPNEKPDDSDLFKPYFDPAEIAITKDADTSDSSSTLYTERSMVTPELDIEFEYEDENDDDDELELDEELEPDIIPESERNPEIEKMRGMFPFLDAEDDEEDVPFDTVPSSVPEFKKPEQKKPETQKNDAPKKPDFKNYKYPAIDLLAKDQVASQSNDSEIQENANKLIETLNSFNVTVSIKGYDRGPRITRYEVVPAAGVKVTQVTNLENDVALALAAGSLRVEAPIPGKSAIGFEIPNKRSEIVRLRDLIETEEFSHSDRLTSVCVGKDVAGFPVISAVEKMPHVLIAGATGMGKSVCINSLMVSMLYKATPADLRFIMIDPKKVEFNSYEGIPHLLVPIVTESKKAAGALMWAVEEMERRYDLISKVAVRNIDAYNEKVIGNPSLGEKLARIVIVIDEFADLMLQVRDPVENLVMSLAQKARAAGIHLIIGTQKPTTNVITGVIKSNIPTRISCRVSSNVDSRIVLDQSGAEKLLDKGDMLFYLPGMLKPQRVQGAFVSDDEINAIMDFLRQGTDGPSYDTEVLDQINKAAAKCDKNNNSGSDYDDDDYDRPAGRGFLNDRKFLDAVEIAVNTGSIATSKLQRKLSIGFGKAAQYIDVMENMGVVGPANGPKAREVLMSPEEWHEKLARTQLDD